jgi:energy-coupling factor transport system permease protein
LNNLRAFRWLLLITFIAHACFTPGQSLAIAGYTLPGLTQEGLVQGMIFTLRLITIMTIAAILMLTTAPLDVSDGLESLLKPLQRFGLPAHELAMMMVIALRFIPTLVEEAERLQKAQMARGADFTGNPIRRARRMTSVLIPLMLSAFKRAEDLAVAMEARCYRGGLGRTHYRNMAMTRNDYIAMSSVIGLLICCWLISFVTI